jgi:hypothetical protein
MRNQWTISFRRQVGSQYALGQHSMQLRLGHIWELPPQPSPAQFTDRLTPPQGHSEATSSTHRPQRTQADRFGFVASVIHSI